MKEILKFIVVSSLCYLGSLGFFWLFLMRDNGLSIAPLSKLFPFVADRYKTHYQIFFHDCTKIWIILLTAVVIVFLYSAYRSAKVNRILAVCIGIFMILAGSVLCFGVNLFISREKYDARAMYGINFLITMLAVFISFHAGHWLFKMVYAVLAWSFVVFSLTYGNALAVQKDYMNHRIELLAGDLSDLEMMNTEEEKYIRIVGDIGFSPVIRNMAEAYPILDRETYSSGDRFFGTGLGEGIWEEYYFYHYLNIPNIDNPSNDDDYRNLPIIKDTMYHTIRGDEYRILIELK